MADLTPEQKRDIYRRLETENFRDLAREYGVSTQKILGVELSMKHAERDVVIRKEFEGGMSVSHLAKKYQITGQRIRVIIGGVGRYRRSDEHPINRAVALARKGMSYHQIYQDIKISRTTLRHALAAEGVLVEKNFWSTRELVDDGGYDSHLLSSIAQMYGRLNKSDMARALAASRPTVYRYIRKLKAQGVIQ